MGINIRYYNPGDGKKISDLFTKNTTLLRDDKFWIWINRILCSDSIVAVAEKNNEIVAHYAFIPRNIIVGNEILKSGIGLHAVVSPDVRNSLSIFQISNLVYDKARKDGYDLIYGFPNTNYRLIQEKIERWIKVSLFNSYECERMKLNLKNVGPYECQQIFFDDFSELYELNNLIEKYNSNFLIRMQSSAQYWLNRYVLHPQKLYKIIKIKYNNKTIAYFVGKEYHKNGIRYTHILDFVFDSSSHNYNLSDMILVICKYFAPNTDVFSFWKGDKDFQQSIIKLGFKETGFDTFFGLKLLSDKAESLKSELSSFSNWRLVMGDSDAF